MRRLAIFLLAFACAGAAGAASPYLERPRLEPREFPERASALRAELEPGGRFEFVDASERRRIEAALDAIATRLDGRASLAAMPEADRVAVFNAQEEINAILGRRDGDRTVCANRELVGTHRRITVCETYRERQLRVRRSREQADQHKLRVQPCVPDSVAGCDPGARRELDPFRR